MPCRRPNASAMLSKTYVRDVVVDADTILRQHATMRKACMRSYKRSVLLHVLRVFFNSTLSGPLSDSGARNLYLYLCIQAG
jgi:hypothetical protein